MLKRVVLALSRNKNRFTRRALRLTLLFFAIEFFDEVAYSLEASALPAMRSDLQLDYVQIGLLLGLPGLLNSFSEPLLMLLGDTPARRRLIVLGGLTMSGSIVLIAFSQNFPFLLLLMTLLYPASGAFVTLSQATLMDQNPGREAQAMARWTVAGSIGDLLGPLFFAAALALGIGWRPPFALLGLFGLSLVALLATRRLPVHPAAMAASFRRPGALLSHLWQAIREPGLMRWILLLKLSDLMLDVLTGYVPLYFTDVVGLPETQASLVLAGLMVASLLSDLAVVPLLERLPARTLVRVSARAVLGLFVAWLLVPAPMGKVVLLIALRLATLGWYPVLQGEAYAAAQGRSGVVNAVSSITGLIDAALAALVGWVASQAGLSSAMWLLLAGPLALALFVPRPTHGVQ